jgi:hypothetical protein
MHSRLSVCLPQDVPFPTDLIIALATTRGLSDFEYLLLLLSDNYMLFIKITKASVLT